MIFLKFFSTIFPLNCAVFRDFHSKSAKKFKKIFFTFCFSFIIKVKDKQQN